MVIHLSPFHLSFFLQVASHPQEAAGVLRLQAEPGQRIDVDPFVRVDVSHEPFGQSQLISPGVGPSQDAIGEVQDGEDHIFQIHDWDGLDLIEIEKWEEELQLEAEARAGGVEAQPAEDLESVDCCISLPEDEFVLVAEDLGELISTDHEGVTDWLEDPVIVFYFLERLGPLLDLELEGRQLALQTGQEKSHLLLSNYNEPKHVYMLD